MPRTIKRSLLRGREAIPYGWCRRRCEEPYAGSRPIRVDGKEPAVFIGVVGSVQAGNDDTDRLRGTVPTDTTNA